MRFEEGGNLYNVRWFFVPDDTPTLPEGSRFGSLNWQARVPRPDQLGEDPGTVRVFDRGETPVWATGRGLCGSAQAFVEGFAAGTNPPPIELVNGAPVCCRPGLPVGGIGVGLPGVG